jgi:hypothetical protein
MRTTSCYMPYATVGSKHKSNAKPDVQVTARSLHHPMPLLLTHELVSLVPERTRLTPHHIVCGHFITPNMPRYSLEEQHMIQYGLDACQRFDGTSIPPICAVKPILNRLCVPCRGASNRASARLFKELRDAQCTVRNRHHEHLQGVLQHLSQKSEAETWRVAITAKEREKAELLQQRESRLQQDWERRD